MIFKLSFTQKNKKSPWISYHTYNIKEKINVIKNMEKIQYQTLKKYQERLKKITTVQSA